MLFIGLTRDSYAVGGVPKNFPYIVQAMNDQLYSRVCPQKISYVVYGIDG